MAAVSLGVLEGGTRPGHFPLTPFRRPTSRGCAVSLEDQMREWLSHFSGPRLAPDPRIHSKLLWPPPQLLGAWQRAWKTSICTCGLGTHVPVIRGDEIPPPPQLGR